VKRRRAQKVGGSARARESHLERAAGLRRRRGLEASGTAVAPEGKPRLASDFKGEARGRCITRVRGGYRHRARVGVGSQEEIPGARRKGDGRRLFVHGSDSGHVHGEFLSGGRYWSCGGNRHGRPESAGESQQASLQIHRLRPLPGSCAEIQPGIPSVSWAATTAFSRVIPGGLFPVGAVYAAAASP